MREQNTRAPNSSCKKPLNAVAVADISDRWHHQHKVLTSRPQGPQRHNKCTNDYKTYIYYKYSFKSVWVSVARFCAVGALEVNSSTHIAVSSR